MIIHTTPDDYEANDELMTFTKNSWFEPADIQFESYHSIDYRCTIVEAHQLIKNASAVLLHGGNAILQNIFLREYELAEVIQNSNASVLIGASAGGMNMSAKWVTSRHVPNYSFRHTDDDLKIYKGLGFDNFALESHAHCESVEALADMDNTKHNLLPLSQTIDVYVACAESTLRISQKTMSIHGDVYLISVSQIEKLKENLC